jgi:hypothetical protein
MTSSTGRIRTCDSDFFVAANLDLDEKSIFGPGKNYDDQNVVKNVTRSDDDSDSDVCDAGVDEAFEAEEEEETSF